MQTFDCYDKKQYFCQLKKLDLTLYSHFSKLLMRTLLKDTLIYELISAFVLVKFSVFLTPWREKQHQITYIIQRLKDLSIRQVPIPIIFRTNFPTNTYQT